MLKMQLIFTTNQFKIALNWSDSSVSQIETVLGNIARSTLSMTSS